MKKREAKVMSLAFTLNKVRGGKPATFKIEGMKELVLKDGSKIYCSTPKLEVGSQLLSDKSSVNNPVPALPLSAGEYELSTGEKIKVLDGGIIGEIVKSKSKFQQFVVKKFTPASKLKANGIQKRKV